MTCLLYTLPRLMLNYSCCVRWRSRRDCPSHCLPFQESTPYVAAGYVCLSVCIVLYVGIAPITGLLSVNVSLMVISNKKILLTRQTLLISTRIWHTCWLCQLQPRGVSHVIGLCCYQCVVCVAQTGWQLHRVRGIQRRREPWLQQAQWWSGICHKESRTWC